MTQATPVVVVTGPCGVGKSAVADAMSELLAAWGSAHALVDVDHLRTCYPAPANDPFRVELAYRNLGAVWANYRAAGARRLVMADVVEGARELELLHDAVPGAEVVVVRLRASLATIESRLVGRDNGERFDWHLRRAAELTMLMERNAIGDLLIDTEGKSIQEVARETLGRVGWADVPPGA